MELKQRKDAEAKKEEALLIVPYGIETEQEDIKFTDRELLIVPYGIETQNHNERNE